MVSYAINTTAMLSSQGLDPMSAWLGDELVQPSKIKIIPGEECSALKGSQGKLWT